jgi:adenylate cyclase
MPRVLAVDDEPDILLSLRAFLESEIPTAEFLAASSAAEALEMMRTTPVDLVISDYRMPVMDGLQFLARSAKLYPEVPRILITAFPDIELAGAAVNEAKVAKFLTKPFRPEVLASTVREILAASKRQRLGQEALRRSGAAGGTGAGVASPGSNRGSTPGGPRSP